VLTVYVLGIIAFFMLSLEDAKFYRYLPKAGLVIGGFFPFIAFIYYYRNYIKAPGLANRRPSVLSWILPAVLTQIIVILGFIILLGYPKPNLNKVQTTARMQDKKQEYTIRYSRSFFSGGLHYGHLFQKFQKEQVDAPNSIELKYEEVSRLFNQYRPYFVTTETETCPPKEQREEYQAYCREKFAQISSVINAIPFYLAITFGFLGALIFSLGDLVVRFNMVDLYPKNFVFYSIRFVVAASLCATLANFFMEEFPLIMAMPVFFLIGYFPERAIKYLDQKMTDYLGFKTYEPLPLSLVQGMSGEKALRLREIGIEDIQHLAVGNIQTMTNNLPYCQDMLCDWIAQSILILYFTKQVEALRDVGVRTILDLQGCLLESPEDHVIECAKKIGISEIQLQHVARILRTDPMRTRIEELRTCMEKVCKLKPHTD
jgi:hypothetical protein